MYVLYKDSWGDFDIQQSTAVAVSENLSSVQSEAARLNAARKSSDFQHGEWTHSYRVDNKKVKVI